MKIYLLIIATLLSVTTYANAEWIKIPGEANNRTGLYYDNMYIIKTINSVKLLTRINEFGFYEKPKLIEIDCLQSKFRYEGCSQWFDIEPDSCPAFIENRFCSRKPKKG